MNRFYSKYKKIMLVGIFAFSLGFFFHSYYYLSIESRSGDILQIRENSTNYKFINPLLLVLDTRNIESKRYFGLKGQIDSYISKVRSEGKANDVSFYFRDLDQSEWVGVNQEDLYAPGSMLKVSVLIAYFKLADENPDILDKKLYYQSTNDPGQKFKPTSKLKSGYYTVYELLNQMIVESDNDALRLLNDLRIDEVLKIYNDLRLPNPLVEETELMSPREYSRLFRVLYNVGYISNKYSEKALDMLSHTNFTEGIESGISSTTVAVAHKFGEHRVITNGVTQDSELHDCGNVYYPGSPYFVCVMTKGGDFSTLAKIISDISRITFNFVDGK